MGSRAHTSQVKFIKFFAWEERWIDRALDARGAELEWMVKGAAVNLYLHMVLIKKHHSSHQLCYVLCVVDVCPHLGVHHFVLHLRHARQRTDRQRCVHRECLDVLSRLKPNEWSRLSHSSAWSGRTFYTLVADFMG